MKNTILLFLLLNIVPSINAQNIVGRVIDERTSTPIEYANVLIINRVDSSFVAGAVTDAKGLFSIPSNTINDKLIKVSYIGYTDYIISLDCYDLKDIKLQIDNTLLDEVNIVGAVQKLENSGISTNIQATYLKNMGTAIDVLGQLPFVHKSGTKIEIFGKGEPLIYINSRLLRDNSQLEELSSEDIKKVTVITNPGAEYDGTVNAVIRIETIKAVGDGISGNTSLNTHFDRKFSHGELLNLNYRKNNWDIFGMLRFAESRNLSYQETNQSVPNRGIITDVEQQVREGSYYKSLKGNIGLNSTIGEHSSYGIRYEYTHTPRTRNSVDADAIVLNNKVKNEEFLSFSNANTKVENNYINLYYLGKIYPWLSGQFDSDIYWGETKRFQNVQNQRFDTKELISTNSKQEYKLFAGKLTLKSPLLGGKLIYGGEYAHTKNTQLFYANEEAIEQGIENNKNKANQDSYAAFVIYNRSWKSLSLEVGMRYENVNFDYYNQHGKLKAESKRYENILPNFSLSYNSDLFQTILSYRSTINRPSYYQLRNDIQYDGPYTYESGNSQLKPIQNKSISLLALWKDFKISTMYTIRKNNILFIPRQYKDDVIIIAPVNLNRSKNLSFSISYSTTISFWNPSVDMGLLKDFLTYGEDAQKYNKEIYFFQIRNNFTLPHKLLFGIDAEYSTNGNSNLSYVYGASSINLYLTKLFLNDKLRVSLNGYDIFNKDRKKREIFPENVRIFQDGDQNSRRLTISINYIFNSTKSKYRGERATNELNRL